MSGSAISTRAEGETPLFAHEYNATEFTMATTSESESGSSVRDERAVLDAQRPARAPWIGALADTLLLLVPLALANAFLARKDPGFLDFNPSPWILLPLVLGARCGLLAGQGGALLAAVAVLLGFRVFENANQLTAVITGEAWFFVSLLVAGAVGGLINTLLTGPTQAARTSAVQLARSEQRMRHDLEMLRESEIDLSQRLLLHGAEFISLQDRMRELLASPVDSLDRGLLDLFQEMFDITRASIYHRNPGDTWRIAACLGDYDSFPDRCRFTKAKNPVASAAIHKKDIATCASLWLRDEAPALIDEPVSLAAIPWCDAARPGEQPHRLLIIDRIPFAKASWENFARIQALFHWLSTVAASAPRPVPAGNDDPPEMLSPEEFEAQLNYVLECSERFRIGYRLVLFERTPNADTASQNTFVRSVRSCRRVGDALGGVMIGERISGQRPHYGIALVLPVDSDDAAKNRIAQIFKPLPNAPAIISHRIFAIAGNRDDFLAEWRSVVIPTPAPALNSSSGEPARGSSRPANSTASDTVPPYPVQPA